MEIIGELIADVAEYVQRRTGSFSIAVNRMVAHLEPAAFLHANCSVQMISPEIYRRRVLSFEQRIASRLTPFGEVTRLDDAARALAITPP